MTSVLCLSVQDVPHDAVLHACIIAVVFCLLVNLTGHGYYVHDGKNGTNGHFAVCRVSKSYQTLKIYGTTPPSALNVGSFALRLTVNQRKNPVNRQQCAIALNLT